MTFKGTTFKGVKKMLEKKIKKSIQEALGIENVELEVPEREEHGDFSTNIAMQIFSSKGEIFGSSQNFVAKKLKENINDYKSPDQLAEHIVKLLKNDQEMSKFVRELEVAGPGFINFWLKDEILIGELKEVLEKGEGYGKSEVRKGKKIIVEYSSPNIAKRFSVGHLRSTIIGQALYNLYENQGYNVISENHLGDWGTQFGMIIAQIVRKGLEPEDLNIEQLEELYVNFNKEMESNPELRELAREWFKKLENGNSTAKRIWQTIKEKSLKEFETIYDLLNVRFENMHGESFYEDKMQQVIEDFRNAGLTKESEGAEIIEYEDMPPAMLLKSDGTTTYFTRDLAAIKFRVSEWDPDKIIYEVGSQQKLHFNQLFTAAERVGYVSSKNMLVHVAHGWYLGEDGKKFSTRKGNTVKLEDILKEAIDRSTVLTSENTSTGLGRELLASKHPEKMRNQGLWPSNRPIREEDEINKDIRSIGKTVGIGSVQYFELMHKPSTDIIFDWDEIINLEGNSGPYLQYTYARTQSVLRKAHVQNNTQTIKNKGTSTFDPDALQSDLAAELEKGTWKLETEEGLLLRHFVHYSGTIIDAAENYSPNLLANYLYELAQKYNSFYNKHRILDAEDGEKAQQFRLALNAATGQILKNGLDLLGIEVPERM